MPRKKPVENAGTASTKRRYANAQRMLRGRAADRRGAQNRSADTNYGPVTSASGTPGGAGVLTTGHYSKNGQRMYGGYGPTGRGRTRGNQYIPSEKGSGLSGNWRKPRLPNSR